MQRNVLRVRALLQSVQYHSISKHLPSIQTHITSFFLCISQLNLRWSTETSEIGFFVRLRM